MVFEEGVGQGEFGCGWQTTADPCGRQRRPDRVNSSSQPAQAASNFAKSNSLATSER